MTELIEAYVSGDGLRTYRHLDRPRYAFGGGNDVAYAGTAQQIATLAHLPHRADWRAFGSPTQVDDFFLLVAPGIAPSSLPLSPGSEPWILLATSELHEFAEMEDIAA